MADEYPWRGIAMVKIGFICEGYTEQFILQSESFNTLLADLNLTTVGVVNVKGNMNLLPHHLEKHRANLMADGVEKIIILTDLDKDLCITKTKERILKTENQVVEIENQFIIIAVKQIEAWFLADSISLSKVNKTEISFNFPEHESVPFETIRQQYFQIHNRGIVGKDEKKRLATKFLNAGFSIQNAASHPNCPSATYFLTKLEQLSPQ